jgi:HEAT repeat protein
MTMDSGLRQKLLAYLTGAAVAFGSGGVARAREVLSDIPVPIIDELVEEVEQEGWRERDLIRLTQVLANDPRDSVRRRAVELLGTFDPEAASSSLEELLIDLSQDRCELVRATCAQTLVFWLHRLGGLSRVKLIAEWTLSPQPLVRLTMAETLNSDVEALGVEAALETLARDKDFRVRAAAARASGRRLQENPNGYTALLSTLSQDEHAIVRRAAKRVWDGRSA